MEKSNPKKELVRRILESSPDIKKLQGWNQNASKVKSSLIFEEAAKQIAKKKLEIQQLTEENQKQSYQLEKLQTYFTKRNEKNEKLSKRKTDLEAQYKALYEDNKRQYEKREQELRGIEERNQEIREEIDNVTEERENQLKEADLRIQKLMQIADKALLQTREEKEARLKYQRSISTLYHLEGEVKKMELITEKQKKKLSILMDLLEASRDHLSRSIDQKTQLLNQTSEAAEKMCELCEKTLKEEQEFYEERDYDMMHTPPYIQVKRRPRK